jgi:hypothetical protein
MMVAILTSEMSVYPNETKRRGIQEGYLMLVTDLLSWLEKKTSLSISIK